MFLSVSPRSVGSGCSTCRLEYAKSWRVNAAARSAASRTLPRLAPQRIRSGDRGQHQLRRNQHDAQEVVEVVSDAAGEAPHRLELGGLEQPLLERSR